MSAASMWTAMQAAIAAVTPYQGSDPVASAAYRAAVGQAMCTAIISEQNSPVAWDGTNDRVLDVGQFTKDSFSAQTSMPLHIACGDGQIYEIDIAGSYTAAAAAANPILQPNNTVPATNSFVYKLIYGGSVAATATYASGAALGGFTLGAGGSSLVSGKFTLFTFTANKKLLGQSSTASSTAAYLEMQAVEWTDTTTPYTSVGTITMPNAWTGQVVCRRVA